MVIGSVGLRLQPAFGLAALRLVLLGAGARNGRMPRRRIVTGIARRLVALQKALDLVAGQGLVFEQAFRQSDELIVLFREDAAGLGIGLVDQSAHFGIDLLCGRFRDVLGLRDRMAEEDFLLVLAIGHLSENVGKAPLRHHGAGKLGGLLD